MASAPRVSAVLALAIVFVALIVVITGSGSTYVVHAQFADAGQLVNGDLVTVAGHRVGSVGSIKLADNGLADVELDISDHSITPIHTGALATIGQLSLTGVANRFVGLTISPAGTALPSGGTLPSTQTRGIVDFDQFLDALTPSVRASLKQLLRTGAYVVHQPSASQLNELSRYFAPAFSQTAQLGAQIVADKFALQRLISSTAEVATALSARASDLSGAVSNTAATFREIASERSALQDSLVRAPAVLTQGSRVLAHLDGTLAAIDPMLADLRPVAPRLATLLSALVPAAQEAIPTITGVRALVPKARAALQAFPAVEQKATPAVRALTSSLRSVLPMLAGIRPYAPDVIAGFFNGVGGAGGGNYDANGHYLRSYLTVQGGGTSLSGLLSLLGSTPALPPYNGVRTRLLAPCPGGGNPPAWDLSNPWVPSDLPNICNQKDDQNP